MKSTIFKPLIFTTIFVTASFVSFGQASLRSNASSGTMFAGEKLIFEGKVSKLKLSLSVAELTFSASQKPDSNDLVIKSLAVSKGTMLKIFRYSFLQEYESVVDLTDFSIKRTKKHDVQKERVRDSEAFFDYRENRVTYIETDPKDFNRPPRLIASDLTEPMNDMISSIYAMRLQPLTVGKKFEMSVSDSGVIYKVPVVVTKRERQKTILGKVWCLRVEPEIFGTNRLIEQEGKMIIWMTDDARHTPVRAKIDSQYGTIEIKLKEATKPVVQQT